MLHLSLLYVPASRYIHRTEKERPTSDSDQTEESNNKQGLNEYKTLLVQMIAQMIISLKSACTGKADLWRAVQFQRDFYKYVRACVPGGAIFEQKTPTFLLKIEKRQL